MFAEVLLALRGTLIIVAAVLVSRKLRLEQSEIPIDPVKMTMKRLNTVAFGSIFLVFIAISAVEVWQTTAESIVSVALLVLLMILVAKYVPGNAVRRPLICAILATGIHDLRPLLFGGVKSGWNQIPSEFAVALWIPEMVLALVAMFYLLRYLLLGLRSDCNVTSSSHF